MEEKEIRPLKLIFLDIDGVLNSEKHYIKLFKQGKSTIDHNMELQPNSLKYLKLLCKKTGAKIVLSSTWRMSEEAVQNIVSQIDPVPLYSKTPMYSACRGEEILKYLADLTSTSKPTTVDRYTNVPTVSHICILDDDSDMGLLTPSLVHTTFKRGFGRKEYKKALKLLTAPYPHQHNSFFYSGKAFLVSGILFTISTLLQLLSCIFKPTFLKLIVALLYGGAAIANYYTYYKKESDTNG